MRPESLNTFDVHNELSPRITEIVTLLEIADEIELGVSPAALRIGILVSVIVEKVHDLSDALDSMCSVERRS